MNGTNDWWDYISHHGVEGMHWGVKNGPPYPLEGEALQKAKASYEKATAKLDKKIGKIEKKQEKANKIRQKTEKKKYGVFSNQQKAQKLDYKANKSQYKVDKIVNKAYKDYKRIEKKYGDKSLNLLDDATIAKGKDLVNRLNARSRALYS